MESASSNEHPGGPCDILIWAHSDQSGGTEIPCLLAAALFKKADARGRPVRVAIVTPACEFVHAFAASDPVLHDRIANGELVVRASLELMRLEKDPEDGSVDPDRTCDLLRSNFFYGPGDADLRRLDDVIGVCGDRVHDLVKPGVTLFISCGEPIALKVASNRGCKRIIVTDHLLTMTVRQVLENGGLLNGETASLMTRFEEYDRSAKEAYLSPIEFAAPSYLEYVAQGGLPGIPISGLFYEPIPSAELDSCKLYGELLDAVRKATAPEFDPPPIVCVFGGGGKVWNSIYASLNQLASGPQFDDGRFALLVKPQAGKEQPWHLYIPRRFRASGVTTPIVLDDPGLGRLQYWYAACDLVVARGGLAAQQILSLMLGDPKSSPHMLFVQEPGHPQIESERLFLYRLGLVHTRTLRTFRQWPLEVIAETLDHINEGDARTARWRALVRYSGNALDSLSASILDHYLPVP